jgi:hypothetical protein
MLLLPFVFNEQILKWDSRKSVAQIVTIQVVLTLFLLPLSLTMAIQYRYLPMHDWDMTYYHMGMSLAHLGMIMYFIYGLGFLQTIRAKIITLISLTMQPFIVIWLFHP